MTFKSINPTNGEVIASFEEDADYALKIRLGEKAFGRWKNTVIQERIKLMLNLAVILEARKVELAKEISLEMGKTLKSATAEEQPEALTCCPT